MKVRIKAVQSFAHNNLDAHAGREYPMNKGDADELEKRGFVEILKDDPPTGDTDSQTDDLLGDSKAAPEVDNKMESAPDNKAAKKK